MKPYPKYIDSGVEWLGEIPEGWNCSRVGFVTRNLDRKRIPLNGEERSYIQGSIPYWGANGIQDYINKFIFNECLVLIGEDGAPFFDKHKDVSFILVGKTWVNNHAHVLRCTNIYELYLKNVLNTVDYGNYIKGSTRDKLNQTDLSCIKIPLPPLPEQKAIATFLDREIQKIDHLIAKQELMIALLEEKLKALISHAVTKGLNPKAKMKDSGIEWLGDIPEHWEVKRFKEMTTRVEVGIAEASTQAYVENGVPIIRSTNIKSKYIENTNLLYLSEHFSEKNKSKYLFGGDLVTVRTGVNIGETSIVPNELNKSQCFTLLMSTPKLDNQSEFLYYFLNSDSSDEYFKLLGWGSAQQNISVPILKNLYFCCPPLQEQKSITKYLDIQTEKLNLLKEKAQSVINLLKEKRSSLISAAVTGKIDVREKK